MARPARLDLVHLGQVVLHRDVFHHPVAAGARDVAAGMRAALPEEAVALPVTVETDGVAHRDRRGIVPREADHPALAPAATGLHVRLPRAVTGLTGVAFLRVARSTQEEASHLRLRERRSDGGMAGPAELDADVALGWRRGR